MLEQNTLFVYRLISLFKKCMYNFTRILLFCFFLLGFTLNATAQRGGSGYKTGIGLRGGYYAAGLSIKHFMKSDAAVEGILGTGSNRRGLMLTLLYEKHGTAFQARGLKWFYGLGGHVGNYRGRYYYLIDKKGRYYYDYYNRDVIAIGVDGILGLEYKFDEIPFTITLDFKPFAEAAPGGIYGYGDAGVTVRYAF